MRVGVVVPHYGDGRYLDACLRSLLAQSRPADAIVVVDSSPEYTGAIIERVAGCITYRPSPPRGVAAARNLGLSLLDTELVSFLDSDNEAERDMLARQVAAHARTPGLTFVHGDLVPIDAGGRRYPSVPRYASEAVPADEALGWLLERNRVATDTVCARREAIAAVGGFCEEPGVREDYDLWLRLTSAGPIGYVPAPLARYRRHDTNLSNDQAYLFDWEAGALRRQDWRTSVAALGRRFRDPGDFRLACAELRLRRQESCEALQLLHALVRDTADPRAAFHLAHIALDQARWTLASAWLTPALAARPNDPALWNNLGVAAIHLGRRETATAAFARAVTLQPAYEDARVNGQALEADTAPQGGWRVTRRRLRDVVLPLAAAA